MNDPRFLPTGIVVALTNTDLLEGQLRENDINKYLGPDSHIDTVDTYARYVEMRFVSLVTSDEVRGRTRVLRSNLVNINEHNLALIRRNAIQRTPFLFHVFSLGFKHGLNLLYCKISRWLMLLMNGVYAILGLRVIFFYSTLKGNDRGAAFAGVVQGPSPSRSGLIPSF